MEGEIMPLPRPCSRCGDRFKPTGRAQKICEKCFAKAQEIGKDKRSKLMQEKL